MSLKDRLTSLHYQQGLTPLLLPLLPLEWGYRLAVSARLLAYRWGWLKRYCPTVPVISIGNLTTGGTGKTPVVIEIARGLVKVGKTVVILSRGYGAPEPLPYARALDPKHGDEAYLMQQQVPEAIVIVGRDRVHTLQKAVKDYRPDVVLLDDGFQYLRLQAGLNILLIDGGLMLGNGHLLPVGPLREPVSQIARADLILITKTVTTEALQTVEQWAKRYAVKLPKLPLQVLPAGFRVTGLKDFNERPVQELEALRTRPVIAFSAIAQPGQFEKDLELQGFRVLKHFRFADHHVYTQTDMDMMVEVLTHVEAEQPLLITTQKDWVKARILLPPAWQDALYKLEVAPALDGQWFYHEFLTQMPELMRAGDGHVHSR